jgi:isochorismate hydrolase
MSQLIELNQFRMPRGGPTLVLVDLHHGPRQKATMTHAMRDALQQCEKALLHARRVGLPVAFTRRYDRSRGDGAFAQRAPQWLSGFMPSRSDMVFEREELSCYGSAPFAEMTKHARGNFVLAGFYGDQACRETALEAYRRRHAFIYLEDASASRGRDRKSAQEIHRSATNTIELCGHVVSTRSWIQSHLCPAIGQ